MDLRRKNHRVRTQGQPATEKHEPARRASRIIRPRRDPSSYSVSHLNRKILLGFNFFFLAVVESPFFDQNVASKNEFVFIEISLQSFEHSENVIVLNATIHRKLPHDSPRKTPLGRNFFSRRCRIPALRRVGSSEPEVPFNEIS